ncbi:MAG: fatty acid desaturase [Planctomycetota bacterium]|nr:fatty acid desaturase [Planctomycetota bacterium]
MIRRKLGLAHPAEIHSILFHLLVLVAHALAFWLWLHPEVAGIESVLDRAAFVMGAALLLGWCSGINLGVNFHDHAHRRIFTRPWMNRCFARTWGVSAGWPAYWWQYSHVVVHHRRLMTDEDWTVPHRDGQGRSENFFRYCLLHYPWRYMVGMWGEYQRVSKPVRRRLTRELVWFLLLFSIPFWIDIPMALCLWVLPAWLANVMVVGPGMVAQHAGRRAPDAEHELVHSNTFTSKLFNLAFFNIGYHAEHHTWPHVHWSELPKLHEEVKGQLIREGAHVVPFGYFRGGLLLSREQLGDEAASAEFHAQHPDYMTG